MSRKVKQLVITALGFGLLSGLSAVAVRSVRRPQLRRLLRRGRPVVTAFHRVEENTQITVQGRHPYCLVTEWRNPVSTVVVHPDNFRRYAMDLSFLREKARPQERMR